MDEKYYICQENNHISTEKFHCLVHIFQKDKVNDHSKWRNKTPKNVEKRRKLTKNEDFHDKNPNPQVEMIVWKIVKIQENSSKLTNKIPIHFLPKT